MKFVKWLDGLPRNWQNGTLLNGVQHIQVIGCISARKISKWLVDEVWMCVFVATMKVVKKSRTIVSITGCGSRLAES
jgi:hypothetical protein